MKKRVLVLGPIMPQSSELKNIAVTLNFLSENWVLNYWDPLELETDFSSTDYYHLWQKKLKKHLNHYDAFLGFSFGGVILQQCFNLFIDQRKPIILFSTPTFADQALQEKLGKVIDYCQKNHLATALDYLYTCVFYPNKLPQMVYENLDENQAIERLLFGLRLILATDSREIIQKMPVDHVHLIGECSQLVNKKNVTPPLAGNLITVPGAGMRVLQDNQDFCKQWILPYLQGA